MAGPHSLLVREVCAAPTPKGTMAVLQPTRLQVECLESRVAPITIYRGPTFVSYAPPSIWLAPPPFYIPPSLPLVPSVAPAAPPVQINSLLAGSAQGIYTSTLRMMNTASGFHFSGKAKVAGLGDVDVYAHVYSVGFKIKGSAHGEMILSNRRGSVIVEIVGPEQTRLAPLPEKFHYRITQGSGAFTNLKESGNLRLTRAVDAVPVRNGIQYVETGSFKLTV